METWLREVRRVLLPIVRGAAVEGDVNVMLVHYRHADRDVIMVTNLTKEPRKIRLRPAQDRPALADLSGRSLPADWELGPDEIRVVQAR